MRRGVRASAWRAAAIVGLLHVSPAPLAGQHSRIEGHVTDEVTGDPVPNVRVLVVGTAQAARTDSLGAYHLEKVQPGPISLRIEADRYGAVVQRLTVEPASAVFLDLEIAPIAVLLDRLTVRASPLDRGRGVVTGGLTSFGAKSGEALAARVPGARVVFTGGGVGNATRILLRGRSMTLPGDPLYYVDGIPVSPPSAPTARNRGGEPSILDLIDPASIERIEVISGAAANAAFGLGSNNGVILIYTKR